MSRSTKKTLLSRSGIILVLLFILAVIVNCDQTNADTASSWAETYKNFIKGDMGDKYALIWLDDDDIPEFMRLSGHYTEIYRYVNGSMQLVTQFQDLSELRCVPSANIFSAFCEARVETDDGHETGHYLNVFSYSDGTTERFAKGGYTESDSGQILETTYEWNGESLSEEEFNQKSREDFAYDRIYFDWNDGRTPDQMLVHLGLVIDRLNGKLKTETEADRKNNEKLYKDILDDLYYVCIEKTDDYDSSDETYTEKWGFNLDLLLQDSDCTYGFYDFDLDGTDELFISQGYMAFAVCKIVDGQIKSIYCDYDSQGNLITDIGLDGYIYTSSFSGAGFQEYYVLDPIGIYALPSAHRGQSTGHAIRTLIRDSWDGKDHYFEGNHTKEISEDRFDNLLGQFNSESIQRPYELYRIKDYSSADISEVPEEYKPYLIIGLKSKSNGKYFTANIGIRNSDKDKYTNYNNPKLAINASKIDFYEMFYLVPCSDGSYALQALCNRKYIKYDSDSLKCESDFIGDNEKLEIDTSADHTKIRLKASGKWLGVKNGVPEIVSSKDEAESFQLEIVSDNTYSVRERMILNSGEWFNIDGKGVGYWNIQNEIGTGETHALSMLGYTMMHRRDKPDGTTIEHDNMQCAVGVKEVDGVYDVIITFQGTGGYSDSTFLDTVRDGFANMTSTPKLMYFAGDKVYCHSGYYDMANKLNDVSHAEANIFHPGNGVGVVANVNGKEVTLLQLLKDAKKGEVRFTLLGHSMGGAMAQCYALILTNYGVSPHSIKGRTFNSALAVTTDTKCSQFTDWYNLCVSSDTVPNGNVTGAINEYGIHRLGHTITLYDNEPDLNTKSDYNIAAAKHEMGRKLLELLKLHAGDNVSYLYSDNIAGYFFTAADNVDVNSKPLAKSEVIKTIAKEGTRLNVTGETYNEYGNKWYLLSEGGNVYSGSVINYIPIERTFQLSLLKDKPIFRKHSFSSDVVYYLESNRTVQVSRAVIARNREGDWIYVSINGITGWIPFDSIHTATYGGLRITIGCPVDVTIYDGNGQKIASISVIN